MTVIEGCNAHTYFYNQSITRIHNRYSIPRDLCFIYVQHAFSPLETHIECLGGRFAGLIPKGSSARSNPSVVKRLETRFPGKIFTGASRQKLKSSEYAIRLLKDITKGQRFAILEYGGYFAASAQAICNDSQLGTRLVGFVEGTENGIKGSDDGNTVGYQEVARHIDKPIISKSRSRIKQIMDRDIGPAIVESCNGILQRSTEKGINDWQGRIGVIGLGSIGKGVLRHLNRSGIKPLVSDRDLAIMAELAHSQHMAVPIEVLLKHSDIVFLNTGSCFLAQNPGLLAHIKDDALLVLCTSGDVEAGIPQLLANKQIKLANLQVNEDIATYKTCFNKSIRIMLGSDAVGQAPNMVVEDGSGSLANLMSDMEFYALGCYLGSNACQLPTHCVSESPAHIQNLIIDQWLKVFHPHSTGQLLDAENFPTHPEAAPLPAPVHPHKNNEVLREEINIQVE